MAVARAGTGFDAAGIRFDVEKVDRIVALDGYFFDDLPPRERRCDRGGGGACFHLDRGKTAALSLYEIRAQINGTWLAIWHQ